MNRKVLLVTLLAFSIGLNLVFIGIAVGRYLFDMSPGRAHFEWMTQEVNEETKRKGRVKTTTLSILLVHTLIINQFTLFY